MKINTEDFKEYGNKLLIDLKSYCEKREGWELEVPNYEGVRVKCDKKNGDGWFLVRLSLHDPVIPVNVETGSIEGKKLIVEELHRFFSNYEKLNIKSLEK